MWAVTGVLLLSAGLTAAPSSAVAHQTRYVQFDSFSAENGLSQNTVRCILQDQRGFLWFGTDDGLDRFDGYRFRVYRQQPDIPAGLPHNRITALLEDRAGRFWVGTMDGLFRFDPDSGHFSPAKAEVVLPTRERLVVHRLCESRREPGVLWVGTSHGLFRMDPEAWRCRPFPDPAEPSGPRAPDPVLALAETPDGRLWIGREGRGLSWLNPATGRAAPVALAPPAGGESKDQSVHDLVCAPDGSLWIGGPVGLDILDPSHDSIRHAYISNFHGIHALCAEPDGSLWLGTRGHGLDLYVPRRAFVEHRDLLEQRPYETIGIILSLCRDRSGNLWIGTSGGGIRKLSRTARRFLLFTAKAEDSLKLPFPNLRAVLEDSAGRLWIGGSYGLACADEPGREIPWFHRAPPGGSALFQEPVQALSEDPAHPGTVLWIGTAQSGLWRLDVARGQATPFLHHPDSRLRLQAASIYSLAWDKNGVLWIGTSAGLYTRRPSTGEFAPVALQGIEAVEPADLSVAALLVDRSGSVWVGTEYLGLVRLAQRPSQPPVLTHFSSAAEGPNKLTDNRITSLLEDRTGTLWVGTIGGGLNRFDRETGAFNSFTTHDGLPDNMINSLVEDAEGQIWVSTRRDLAVFRPGPAELSFRNYTAADGLQENRFSENSGSRGRGGWLYFGGLSGLTAFRPASLRPNPLPPPVEVTDFKLFNRSVGSLHSLLSRGAITLDYQDAQFSIEFTALDFTEPAMNLYAYRLQGLEPRWIYTDASHRTAAFYKPDPGEYVFQVRAANSDGVWNEAGWSIPVVIRPPYYRSAWFLSLVALGILGVTGAAFGWTVRQYRKKSAERLEMVNTMVEISETERQRIGLELHDNLSHDLVSIAVQCRLLAKRNPDLAPETTAIEEKIKEAIQQTRSIARGLFPLALAENGLPAMIDEIQYMIRRDYQIACAADVDPEIQIEDLRVAAHLYYIAREAMLNAARHSGTDRLTVGLRTTEDTICLTVRDYGRGAGSEHPGPKGMGLKIMEYRARLIGGHFEIRQHPDGGTEVACTVPWSEIHARSAGHGQQED